MDAESLWRLAAEAARRRGAEPRSVRYEFFMAGRRSSTSRSASGGAAAPPDTGLELFEELLDLGVAEAVTVARSTKHRLPAGTRLLRRPRRNAGQNL
jgi:hypothetical protein